MFSALLKKEFLLVLRDKYALMALFIMPAIFILVMSVAMRDIFSQESVSFKVAIENHDKSAIAQRVVKRLLEDKNFQSVSPKDADILLVLPQEYVKANKKLQIEIKNSLKIEEVELLKAKLLKHLITLKLDAIEEKLNEFSDEAAAAVGSVVLEENELLDVRYNKKERIPNSTQQSVPTWIVFGMFFIIIPMSTIYIQEREQNTLARLLCMNIPMSAIVFSKIVPYIVIAQLQMIFMIFVGVFIVPFLNTPALEITGSLSALVFISFSLSLSAIGLSSLIAVSAKTTEQATTIGGISNILLGAIGGIMVPKFIMPDFMQTLANISPMSWGLDGFLKIFLQSASLGNILNESFMLIAFGIITLLLSVVILKIRVKNGL
jgi:ABC-2 type transport system permease protein